MIAVGLAVLAGWLLELSALTYLASPGANVKTNAGLALFFGGLANLLLLAPTRTWRWLGRIVAVLPVLIGALTLSEHLVGWDLGIDQLLASEPEGAFATTSPNRMGPPASVAFVLLGLALLLTDIDHRRARVIRQTLALTVGVLAILPILGYAYGISPLYAIARYTGISLTTAVTLLLLAISILAGRPDIGFVALLSRDDEVGRLARGLLPTAILLPFGLGWLLARGLEARVIDGAIAISAMALVLVFGLTALIWRTGRQLARAFDDRLAAEQALSESERSLREANRQKTEFLATLSHELRNPLAPIRFALELLNGPPATAERARHTIGRQVQHLVRLIDDLLDLTRITRNKLKLHVREAELRHIVNDALDAVSIDISQAGHRLDVRLPEEPVWLSVDPDRVMQILTNLLTNAARYTPANGNIILGAEIEGADIALYVRDNGAGIDAADLPRLFDMFVQVGEARHGGLGIGLALVKGLAELHGGSVSVRSDGPGLGSEFRVRLPCVTVSSPAPSPEPDAPVLAHQRILVVDDNEDAADMLADVLTKRGHQVQVAYDGPDALRLAGPFRPQVGLLDLGMPGMSGLELAEHLRRAPETTDALLLIAITGWGQEEDRRRAMAAGFDAHVTKPADPDTILALVAELQVNETREEERH